jgi:hypothetical protein
MSTDPAFQKYLPPADFLKNDADDESLVNSDLSKIAKLPGEGGIYNPINLNLYHYAGNNPILYTDPDGLAHFGKRPMNFTGGNWMPPLTNNPLDNLGNTEILHEHLFFDDGTGYNVGFGWTGRFSERTSGKNYKMNTKMYDDALMYKAIKNVVDGEYSLLGEFDGKLLNNFRKLTGQKPLEDRIIGKGKKNNCQDWASKVRKEYNKLFKALSKEERTRIKAELKIKEKALKESLKSEK